MRRFMTAGVALATLAYLAAVGVIVAGVWLAHMRPEIEEEER